MQANNQNQKQSTTISPQLLAQASKENNKLQQNWLSQALVQRLFAYASIQFKDETYDINKIARENICFLQFQHTKSKHYNSPSQKISKQIFHFCSLLGQTPKYFIQLLNEEIITSHSHIVTLNSRNQQIAKRFFNDFFNIYPELKEKQLPKYYSNQKVEKEMYGFINAVAKKVCKLYDECCGMLKKDVQQLTQRIKISKIMNNYLLFKIFRQLSQSIKRIVQERCTQTVFRNCPEEVIHNFFHYIINKFEVVKLFANQEISHSMFQPIPTIFFSNFQRNDKIQLMPKEAVNSEGKFGIFVKTFSEDPELQRTLQDYLLILDQNRNLRVVNCKTIRKKWYIINDIKTNIKLTTMAKDYILQGQSTMDALTKAKPQPITQLVNCEPLQSFTNFNGVIGRCLYLMKRYTGVSHFFKDLSQRAILTRSMQQLMYHIPILGYMIFAGTFSAGFYKIFANKFSTDRKKMKELGCYVLGTTATVGSSVLGAVTGQLLIPIPVVGALIGGAIGGFIGDKSTKQISSWYQKKKFHQTIVYLQKSQIDRQFWLCTPEFYKILQIKQQQFNKYVPHFMQDYVFATIIGFVLACFYESKRLNHHNTQKSKNEEAEKGSSILAGYNKKRQKQFEQQVQKLSYQQQFQTQFDIMKMVQFLQENNATIYEHYDTLQKSILTNLSKIIN